MFLALGTWRPRLRVPDLHRWRLYRLAGLRMEDNSRRSRTLD